MRGISGFRSDCGAESAKPQVRLPRRDMSLKFCYSNPGAFCDKTAFGPANLLSLKSHNFGRANPYKSAKLTQD